MRSVCFLGKRGASGRLSGIIRMPHRPAAGFPRPFLTQELLHRVPPKRHVLCVTGVDQRRAEVYRPTRGAGQLGGGRTIRIEQGGDARFQRRFASSS